MPPHPCEWMASTPLWASPAHGDPRPLPSATASPPQNTQCERWGESTRGFAPAHPRSPRGVHLEEETPRPPLYTGKPPEAGAQVCCCMQGGPGRRPRGSCPGAQQAPAYRATPTPSEPTPTTPTESGTQGGRRRPGGAKTRETPQHRAAAETQSQAAAGAMHTTPSPPHEPSATGVTPAGHWDHQLEPPTQRGPHVSLGWLHPCTHTSFTFVSGTRTSEPSRGGAPSTPSPGSCVGCTGQVCLTTGQNRWSHSTLWWALLGAVTGKGPRGLCPLPPLLGLAGGRKGAVYPSRQRLTC